MMKRFLVLIVAACCSQLALAEASSSRTESNPPAVASMDVRILTVQAAKGDAAAMAALTEMAKQGDAKARKALEAIAGQQLATQSTANNTADIQALAMKAGQGDPAARAKLVAMAKQGNTVARTVLEALAVNQQAVARRANQPASSKDPSAAMATGSVQMNPRILALLPPGVMESVAQMAQMEKDPNMDDEFQHILYWMGEHRRCQVKQNGRGVSVLGVMVMLEKAYEQFKPVLPNLESLLMLAAVPRNPDGEGTDSPIILHCRKQEPINLVDWVIPEVHRYRASRAKG